MIPEVLIEQLKPPGILVAPVGEGTQDLVVMHKTAGGQTTTHSVIPVSFVPMTTMRERFR
jgi:protein-L-isoaspartate(D-aspartate) O-methyltransferase